MAFATVLAGVDFVASFDLDTDFFVAVMIAFGTSFSSVSDVLEAEAFDTSEMLLESPLMRSSKLFLRRFPLSGLRCFFLSCFARLAGGATAVVAGDEISGPFDDDEALADTSTDFLFRFSFLFFDGVLSLVLL